MWVLNIWRMTFHGWLRQKRVNHNLAWLFQTSYRFSRLYHRQFETAGYGTGDKRKGNGIYGCFLFSALYPTAWDWIPDVYQYGRFQCCGGWSGKLGWIAADNRFISYPEDINGGADTAPSKRLMRIFPYEKTADGEMILEALDIDDIRGKCPRFNKWMEKLEEGLKNGHF